MIYAELNENNICIGVKMVSGEINLPNHIPIENADFDYYVWRKYENGEWSEQKFEPVSTAPIEEFEQLKQNNEMLGQALVEKELQIGQLQLDNMLLGQYIVETELRLQALEGGVS